MTHLGLRLFVSGVALFFSTFALGCLTYDKKQPQSGWMILAGALTILSGLLWFAGVMVGIWRM